MDNVILFPTLWNVFYDCQAALTLSRFYTVAVFCWYCPKIEEGIDFVLLLETHRCVGYLRVLGCNIINRNWQFVFVICNLKLTLTCIRITIIFGHNLVILGQSGCVNSLAENEMNAVLSDKVILALFFCGICSTLSIFSTKFSLCWK